MDEVPALMPAEARPVEPARQPLVEPTNPTCAVEAPTTERIRQVDAAFRSDRQHQDSMVGLVGLWLTSPWIGDLIAEPFRAPPEEEDEDRSGKCC